MISPDFPALLKRTMGLDADTIGASAIEHAVQQRMAACGAVDPAVYLDRVRASEAELQELIEAVVVPETWFFRDREAFAALARVALEEWLRLHPDGMLRVLSLPCSTGEEPYSMAIALLDAGLPATRFRVDAVDISTQALARAARATYGKNSFRTPDLGFRDRHFHAAGVKWQLSPAVRQQVHFQAGNLFDDNFLPGAERYDVIFCRNVLIYFDRPTQDRAVAVLQRLLAARGFLFVGPSETGLLLNHAFVSARLPLAFAFRRTNAAPPPPAPSAPLPKRAAAPPPRVFPAVPVTPVSNRSPAPVAAPVKSLLEEAGRLADQGHLAEAAQRCEEHLRTHGPSAQAFYLLGLMRDAAGNHASAADLYRQAIYLEPHHLDALLHLALLREKRGDTAGAKVLNDRARRLQQKQPA